MKIIRSNLEVLEPYMSGDPVEYRRSEQKYSSKRTAVNGKQGKTPKLFKMVSWKSGTINLDYGGGTIESDAVADAFFEGKGVTNVIYDIGNFDDNHNNAVIRYLKANGGADTATLSNVLNVIMEKNVRHEILENIYDWLKPNGILYIYGYEGPKEDIGKGGKVKGKDQDQYQTNMRTSEYLPEIAEVFPNYTFKNGLITCKKTNVSASRGFNAGLITI